MQPRPTYFTQDFDSQAKELSLIMYQRIVAKDAKGRIFGTPGCPTEPTLELFRPRIAWIKAGDLSSLIGDRRRHPIFQEQLAEVRKLDNDGLILFRIEDPISAIECPEGLSLTGGHHRTHEIDVRVSDGRMRPETLVEVLLHD